MSLRVPADSSPSRKRASLWRSTILSASATDDPSGTCSKLTPVIPVSKDRSISDRASASVTIG